MRCKESNNSHFQAWPRTFWHNPLWFSLPQAPSFPQNRSPRSLRMVVLLRKEPKSLTYHLEESIPGELLSQKDPQRIVVIGRNKPIMHWFPQCDCQGRSISTSRNLLKLQILGPRAKLNLRPWRRSPAVCLLIRWSGCCLLRRVDHNPGSSHTKPINRGLHNQQRLSRRVPRDLQHGSITQEAPAKSIGRVIPVMQTSCFEHLAALLLLWPISDLHISSKPEPNRWGLCTVEGLPTSGITCDIWPGFRKKGLHLWSSSGQVT